MPLVKILLNRLKKLWASFARNILFLYARAFVLHVKKNNNGGHSFREDKEYWNGSRRRVNMGTFLKESFQNT